MLCVDKQGDTDMLDQTLLRKMDSLARPLRLTRVDEAAGRCLSASLDLAHRALLQHGVALQLVKWCVLGDPHYVDHWAVLRDADSVWDVTRIQVDARRELVYGLDSYPPNFQNRRIYPASLLLAQYTPASTDSSPRLPSHFLWHCGTSLLRFDLGQAWQQRSLSLAWSTALEGGRFLKYFWTASFTRWLEQRSRQLLTRLQAQPTLSARSMHGAHNAAAYPMTLQRRAKEVMWNASTLTLAANSHVVNLCTVLTCL
jgi:hypothetical protein